MRLFEYLILAALLPPLIWTLFRRQRPNWLVIFPVAGSLFIVLHLFVEGYRWQMAPAYLFTAVSLTSFFRRKRQQSKPVYQAILTALLGLLVWLAALALPTAMPVPHLPEPTGPYAIGTFSTFLVDPNRPEIYTDNPDDNREIMVQVWYPATNPGNQPAQYMENLEIAGPVIAEQFDLPSFLLNHINLTDLEVWLDVPVAQNNGRFPIIVFSHGLTGIRMQNTVMVRELVSHGYVVAAIDHTYANALSIFPDGRVFVYDPERIFPSGRSNAAEAQPLVQQWAGDIAFVLDVMAGWNEETDHLLNGRLNLDQVGIFGHSTGGGATLQFCLQDGRCQAGVGLDSWLLPVAESDLGQGPGQPFMFIGTPEWLGKENRARGETIFNNLPSDGYWLALANTGHYDFTDLPLLTPLTPQLGLSGSIDSRYSLGIQTAYLLAFFDHYLKNEPAPLLTAPSAYPELTIQQHGRP